ncbi:MAG: hypothetical protein WAN12_11435 [Candidatus Acidiferrum sp.]
MIRSKVSMGILWTILAVALHLWPGVVGPAQGQGSRKDDIVFNTRGVPLAGATVRVCAMPASGQPCTPLALIYSDPGLSQALANPTTTDGLGNYSFYAAPGKYEIEISGPGITTKQLPNVILPSDPSSPTFSSISSTGAINAFTLSLTGNLTVNGSTSVVGNLASSTLSLSNQSTAPGTPGAGSVNFYTKTADKRLYYKDDTGVEVGPIASGSGAQTNTPNTFTAPQNIDADFHTKGPNPWYDLSRYGWYTSPTYYKTGTTGTMSAASATLALSSALDFANGQGLVVLGAGPTPTISTPTSVTAAAVGATGSTTYYYCVVDEDYLNGRTACSAAGSVANAVATLGIQTYTITAGARASGVVTITAANSIISGSQVEVQNGTTGDHSFEGAFTTTSSSSSNVFFNQYGVSDASGTVTSGNLRVVGMVAVKWQAPSPYTVLKHLIYRCTGASCSLPTNAANYNLVGVAQGQDSYFLDRGYGFLTAYLDNGDASQTAPTSTSNGWLATIIVSGGGTTTLTLAGSATNAVSGVAVKHDNAPIIKAACAVIPVNTGAPILFAPATPGAGAYNYAPFSSFFTFSYGLPSPITANCPAGTEIDFQSELWLNAPIQLGHNITMKGGSGGQISSGSGYFEAPMTLVAGYAYPMIYVNGQASTNDFMANFKVSCNGYYQACVYEDQASNGDGPTDFRYDDVYLVNTNGVSNAYVAKSGFGRFWTRGIWQTSANDFSSPTAALFTTNCGTGQTSPLPPLLGYTNYTSIYGGLLVDGCGVTSSAWNHWTFTELLVEGGYIPAIRIISPNYGIANINIYNFSYADILGGYSTPAIDLTNTLSNANIVVTNAACATGYQPLFEVGTSGNYQGIQVFGAPCSYLGANNGIVSYNTSSYSDQLNWNTRLQNASHVAYQMAPPAAPQSAVASSGGAVPLGAHTYQFSAVDADGNETTVGPAITGTATTGNQTITVTAPATFPSGAVGLNLYRDSGMINPNGASCSTPQVTAPGGTLVDNYLYKCSSNTPYSNQAGASLVSSGGLSTYKLHLGSEALTASPRGEQNIFLPGALTSTWTGATWTPDKGVTVTRVQVQAKTAPAGCTTNAVVRLTDGAAPVNLSISGAANDSGIIAQNYAAGTPLTLSVQTAAAGCTTSPADANVTIQYRMQ